MTPNFENTTWQTIVHGTVETHLDFKGEVFLHVFDNHDEVGQFDSESLPGIGRASDVSGRHVGTHNLQDKTLDVGVGDALDVT